MYLSQSIQYIHWNKNSLPEMLNRFLSYLICTYLLKGPMQSNGAFTSEKTPHSKPLFSTTHLCKVMNEQWGYYLIYFQKTITDEWITCQIVFIGTSWALLYQWNLKLIPGCCTYLKRGERLTGILFVLRLIRLLWTT